MQVDITSYTSGPNPVMEFPFELLKNMPERPKPLLEQIGREYLFALVQRIPTATLSEYARIIQRERGVQQMSDQTMCKMFRKVGLTGMGRRGLWASGQRKLAA